VDLNLADGWSGPRLVGSLSAMGIRSVIVSGQIEEFDAPGHVLGVLPKPVDEQALAALLQCAAADRQRDSGQD
jgi:hypothetical protein